MSGEHTKITNMDNKSKIIGIAFLLSISTLFSSVKLNAQCVTDNMLNSCAVKLGDYNFIHFFSAKKREIENSEYYYIFSKESEYKLIACDEELEEGKVIMTVYDRDHNQVASNYDESGGRYKSELILSCSATGLYYIKVKMRDSSSKCGLCIIGIKI